MDDILYALCRHCVSIMDGCGHVMDRDEQAAKNIDEEGLHIYRQLQNLLFA